MIHFHINHIDDVLTHIAGRPEFIVAERDGYKVIDYVYAGTDSFDHPARLECRGLKFAPDGALIARPLHKFFNINEREDTQASVLDFTQPHTIMEKLDGSMIHACLVKGKVVFMTRMGHTDVAQRAESLMTPAISMGCETLLKTGWTPIFEWTAPNNRIIIRYEQSKLTLLAIRDTATGYYGSRDFCDDWAISMGVDLVERISSDWYTASEFVDYAKAIQGAEGFVICFDNGTWVKAKGEDYVLKHKAKDSILQEKNILALVLNGELDDVLPLLEDKDAGAARAYRDSVDAGIAATASNLSEVVSANSNLSQKEFALIVAPTLPPLLRSAAFQIRQGNDPGKVVRTRVAANTNSSSQVDECRPLHGAIWNI